MSEELKLETIARGQYCGLEGPSNNWVINTEQAWSQFYTKLESKSYPRPATPYVDFNQYTVIATFLGEFSSGGYSTEIHTVLHDGKNLEVQIQASSPAEDEVCSSALSQPYHIVKIPLAEGKALLFNYCRKGSAKGTVFGG